MPPYSHCCDGPSSPVPSSTSRPALHCPRPPLRGESGSSLARGESDDVPTRKTKRDAVADARREELLRIASMELETMRPSSSQRKHSLEKQGSGNSLTSSGCSGSNHTSVETEVERPFPPACLALLRSLPGNSRCHDCCAPLSAPSAWASVSYGIALCLRCSGRHRGLGVGTSFVKSLALDSWKRGEILCMLEGGNEQLDTFFGRHGMGGGGSTGGEIGGVAGLDRYTTKAASFYRQHLLSHSKRVAEAGPYKGREASRGSSSRSKQHGKAKSSASSLSKVEGRKKSRDQHRCNSRRGTQLPTVTEKETEPTWGTVGA